MDFLIDFYFRSLKKRYNFKKILLLIQPHLKLRDIRRFKSHNLSSCWDNNDILYRAIRKLLIF